MKSRAVRVDYEDRRLPFFRDRIVLKSPETDEHVAGRGPRRLEVPVAGRDRLTFRLADFGDMDLPVAEVRDPRHGLGGRLASRALCDGSETSGSRCNQGRVFQELATRQ